MMSCIASDVMRFYFIFSAMGFVGSCFLYQVALWLSKHKKWTSVSCVVQQDGYEYWADGKRWMSKNYSISTEMPFSAKFDFSNVMEKKSSCWIRSSQPRIARIENRFHTFRESASIIAGLLICPVPIYFFIKWCGYLDRTAEIVVLTCVGALTALIVIALHREEMKSEECSK